MLMHAQGTSEVKYRASSFEKTMIRFV